MSDALIAVVGPEPPERDLLHVALTGEHAEPMPWPAVVLLALHPDGPMAYRYARDGRFGGDTWHESRQAALDALDAEYGPSLGKWEQIPADEDPHEYALHVARAT